MFYNFIPKLKPAPMIYQGSYHYLLKCIKSPSVFFKLLIVTGFIVLTNFQLPAQDTTRLLYPNTLKVNVVSAFFSKATLAYERQINDRWSVLAGVGYKFRGKIPEIAGVSDFMFASATNGLRAYTFYAETRYRILGCDCRGPEGLYAGAYIATNKFWGDLVFKYWTGNEYIDVGGQGDLLEAGIGLELGYQFVFRDRFILDIMFMGPRRSYQQMNVNLDSQYAEQVLQKLEERINGMLEFMGVDPVEIPKESSSSVNFGFNNFRYAISFGYRF
jgi:hypothetical protein